MSVGHESLVANAASNSHPLPKHLHNLSAPMQVWEYIWDLQERLTDADLHARSHAAANESLASALIRCAELAGEDGEAVEAARSGAMTYPSVEMFAIRAVEQLRKDIEETG